MLTLTAVVAPLLAQGRKGPRVTMTWRCRWLSWTQRCMHCMTQSATLARSSSSGKAMQLAHLQQLLQQQRLAVMQQ
jgi:hypothetical protein